MKKPTLTDEQVGFLSESQLLKRLPVCRRTLKHWRDAGLIPFIRIGTKRIVYHWDSFEKALLKIQHNYNSEQQ